MKNEELEQVENEEKTAEEVKLKEIERQEESHSVLWKKFSHNKVFLISDNSTIEVDKLKLAFKKKGLNLYEDGKNTKFERDIYDRL